MFVWKVAFGSKGITAFWDEVFVKASNARMASLKAMAKMKKDAVPCNCRFIKRIEWIGPIVE